MPSGLDGNPDPISTPQREELLGQVAEAIVGRRQAGAPLLVAIDGIDGSGKTTFADVGFYLDSHDLEAVRGELLDPFRAGVGATCRTAVFDEPTGQSVDTPVHTVGGDEILVFDGILVCRPELVEYWDYTVFLDGQDRVSLTRLGYVLADAPDGGNDLVAHVLRWAERIDRYASGMRLYLDAEDPVSRVDLVVDNNHLERPSIIERPRRANRSSPAR